MMKGYVEAPSDAQAMLQVDQMGLIPIDVRQVSQGVLGRGGADVMVKVPKDGKAVPMADLIMMTRQMMTLLQAGVPIMNCMDALVAQTTQPMLRAILQEMQKDIQNGTVLSATFAKFPKTFSTMYIHTVRAGETGGILPEVLSRMADMLENELETTRAVKSALRYPVMVVIALVIAFFVLITFVVPKFAALFARFNTQLPLPTRILIGINTVVRDWWFIAIPTLAGLGFAAYQYVHTVKGRYQWDTLLLKLPVFGNLILKFSMARFAQMFSMLYKSGVPVLRVIDIVSQTLGNAAIGREVAAMAESVKQGQGLSEPLKKSRYFPPLVVHMISVGEKSGSVDEMLIEVAKNYDMETKYLVRNLTSMIEPMLIVGLGCMVLLLALGIFMPMWNMIKLYH